MAHLDSDRYDKPKGLTVDQAKDHLIIKQNSDINELEAENETLRFRAILGWGAAAFFLGIELIKWVSVSL